MLLWRSDVAGNNKTYLDRHVNWSMFLADFNQIRQILITVSTIKFNISPPTVCRTDTCGQTANGAFSDLYERA
jgi:hypothetical protein